MFSFRVNGLGKQFTPALTKHTNHLVATLDRLLSEDMKFYLVGDGCFHDHHHL